MFEEGYKLQRSRPVALYNLVKGHRFAFVRLFPHLFRIKAT